MTDEELIARLRELASFELGVGVMQDFYCGDEMVAAADRIEALTKALRLAFDAGFDNGWDHARSTSIYDEQPLGCDDAFAEFLKEMEGTEK